MEKLTRKEKWMGFWGFAYFANFGTKEIHRLENKHVSCRLHMIANGRFVTKRRALRLIHSHGFNGCRYCWKDKNKE